MSAVSKHLAETLNLINETSAAHKFVVMVGKSKNHPFNGRDIDLSKDADKFLFSIITIIRKGIQDKKEIDVPNEVQVRLSSENRTIFTKGKYIIPRNISYPDFASDSLDKQVQGEITSISTRNYSFYERDRYYRMVLPLYSKVRLFGDFEGWHYVVDGIKQFDALIKIVIDEREFHFFVHESHDKKSYLVIDSMAKDNLNDFQKRANSILLAYAFLKGDYYGKESFILCYKDNSFKKPDSLLSVLLGNGIRNGFPVHSTNPYSFVNIKKKAKYKKDAEGNVTGLDTSSLDKYQVEFPSDALGKLCELICNKGGILRAIILFINNEGVTLEMRLPTLFVALENISRILVGDTSVPKIIENTTIEKAIKDIVKTSVKELGKIKKDNKPTTTDVQELKDYDSAFARIESKFYGFNNGTNNKKLVEPFAKFGYSLSDEESVIILTHRNKFLHGSDFMSLEASYELEFKELFHMSLRLHTLIAILLLKASGYSGYILNNAKIYDYISEKKLKEEVFIYI